MMLLAFASPFLAIGLVMVLELLETWTLGGPKQPAQPGQPSRWLQSPRSEQHLGAIPTPLPVSPTPIHVVGS
jgi:hypothetical protein